MWVRVPHRPPFSVVHIQPQDVRYMIFPNGRRMSLNARLHGQSKIGLRRDEVYPRGGQ